MNRLNNFGILILLSFLTVVGSGSVAFGDLLAPKRVKTFELESGVKGVPDAIKPGFFRYEFGGWEMVYNPVTKEIWHLQPIR